MEPAEDLEQTVHDVRAAQEGSRTALSGLCERYLPRVRGIAAARMGQRLQAVVEVDDLVQESMRLAILGLERFEHRTEGSFRHWLAQCVENAIRKEIRKLDTSKRGSGRVQRVADLAQTRLAESLFPDASAAHASEVVRAKDDHSRVEAALLELSPRYREVIALRVHAEMSYREVAEAMGLPSENTANALFLRARQKLQQRLHAG